MKTALLLLLTLLSSITLTAQDRSPKQGLIMHEWGTFTTHIKYGSNGKLLYGLEKEEEFLPNFVHQFHLNSFLKMGKGFGITVKNVSVKMETPVVYFYTKEETPFTIDVHFNGGKISQWFPQKSGGGTIDYKTTPFIDFKQLRQKGHVQWQGTVLAKNSIEQLTHAATNHKTWLEPRKTDSNLIKVGKEVEKYLFYRGLGNFETPFMVSFEGHRMKMENQLNQEIPYIMIFRSTKGTAKPEILWEGAIKSKQSKTFDFNDIKKTTPFHKDNFTKALIKEGLYKKEAHAMLNTWDTSYFKKKGLRIFWVLPEQLTEEILPMSITPTPTESKRVMVGRINIIK